MYFYTVTHTTERCVVAAATPANPIRRLLQIPEEELEELDGYKPRLGEPLPPLLLAEPFPALSGVVPCEAMIWLKMTKAMLRQKKNVNNEGTHGLTQEGILHLCLVKETEFIKKKDKETRWIRRGREKENDG